MRIFSALILGFSFFLAPAAADEPIRMASAPDLSPDGKTIAFAWRGDVWTASIEGGQATQLTTDPGSDGQPHFSPDGKTIAFVSDRTGSRQIYLVDSGGGAPRQVTFHSEGYTLHDWFPDGGYVLASGSRDHHWRGAERLLKVNVDQRRADIVLADATASTASLDRDGKRVLFVREGERWWRKGYRGERAAQIWLLDLESGEFTEILHEGVGCRWPVWHKNGKSFFFTKGDIHGFDLWRCTLPKESDDEPKQTRMVDFEDDSVVFPTIGRNQNVIVFRHLFDFYRFRPGKDQSPTKIELTYAGDPNVDPDELRRELDDANEVAFTDDGLEIVVAAGGDLWGMDTELREPVRITNTGSFESSPIFAPDFSAVYTVAKRDGQVDIWKIEKLDSSAYWWQAGDYRWTQLTDDPNPESDLKISADGQHLYYIRDLGDLHRMTLGSDADPILLTHSFSAPDYDLSPCGHWVAYAETDDDFNTEIWIRKSDGSGEPQNISQHPDDDRSPRFSPDGKLLAFTGRRVDTESDIYYVWLQDEESERTERQRKMEEALQKMKKARSDDAPSNDEPKDQPESGDDENADDPSADSSESSSEEETEEDQETAQDEDDAEEEACEPIEIDFEKITERIQRISIGDTNERGLFWSPEGDKLLFYASIDGENATYSVTFPDELNPKKVTDQRIGGARWTKEAKGILGIVNNAPAMVDPSGKVTRYPFEVPQVLSRSERFRDAFEVAWMTMRDRWYDPRHAGRNWAEVRRKYIDMAAQAGDESTFAEVVQLMLGELNGSHNGFYASRNSDPPRQAWEVRTAHLGVRFDASHNGPGLLVRDVLPGGPADRVDSQLKPGDTVISIDGVEVDPAMDLTRVLNGRLDRDIQLSVSRSTEGEADAEELQITVRPISFGGARSLLYDAWLEHNRQMVDEMSDGKFGYLHIRAMNMPSFYEFERQLYRVGYGKDGLVIDVRDNGGGSTTDLLLTALTQPRHAITVPRSGGPGYPQSRMVFAVWQKPIVVLCNQNSYSNAEIFSHAIKSLGRGKLVGVQTAGGVISTGSTRITDVGTMRMPFRGWFVAPTGMDMELNGALPHFVLWPAPGELPAGVDRQLDKAVEVLKQEIAENPPENPELIYAHEDEHVSTEE